MNKVINSDPHGRTMCQWFTRKFPQIHEPKGNDLVEVLSQLIFSTKEHRLGPMPPAEKQVIIRDVIHKSIEAGVSIPMLIPWGGRKAIDGSGIDIAEVSAIIQIIELDKAIRTFYPHGIRVNIRIEDINARWLWRDNKNIIAITNEYKSDMIKLSTILGGDTNIYIVPESSLIEDDAYFNRAKEISALIYPILCERVYEPNTDIHKSSEFIQLRAEGWVGDFSDLQIRHYMGLYSKLYPDNTIVEQIAKLADYFAGSKARYDLNGIAAPATIIRACINLSFTPEIPGAPVNLFNNTIYWRTVPLSQARTHVQPWRGLGYLKIGNDNSVSSKVTSPYDAITSELIPSTTILKSEKDNLEVSVSTPYLLVD